MRRGWAAVIPAFRPLPGVDSVAVAASAHFRLHAEPLGSEERLTEYVRRCGDLMGLRDWTLEMRWDERPGDPGALASCETIEGRKTAVLRFNPAIYTLPTDEVKHAIVHELVHPHFAALCDGIRHAVQPWMPSKTYEMFWDACVLDLEPAVDAMAEAIEASLPEFVWSD